MTPAEKMIEEIPEKTTIQNVLKKENEWLAFRWKVAGCEKELPSLELVTERLNKILYDFSERKGYRIKRAVALQRKMDGLPETNADLWVLSAIQVVQGTAEENNNMAIRIVTKIGEDSESTLMLLSLITQNVNEKTYIRSILATNPKATLEQLFWDACRIHDNIGDSVQDRWMRQKYEFRTKNPICPQCGATLEKRYKRDGQEDYYCNSCYPRIDTLISRLAHKTIDSSNLVISGKVRRYFELCGCSETKARDVALCVSVLRRVHDMESPYEQNSFFHDPQEIARQEGNDKSQNAEEQKPKDDAVEKQAESKTIQKLQLRIRELEREAQNARHELALLKKENAALQNHCNECSDLIDAYEKMAQEMNEQQTKEETDKNAFPYYTNKNIVLYGGFDCFLNEIKELLPDVKNIPNISHTIDPSPLRGADAIFVQLNHISHSAYYFLRDFTKRNKIPFYLLKNANAEICANIMVRQIEKLQQQEK